MVKGLRIIEYKEENAEEIGEIIKRGSINLEKVMDTVDPILSQVQKRGDEALFILTRKLDKYRLSKDNIRVSGKEIRQAKSRVDKKLISSLKEAAENIRGYHEKQRAHIEDEWTTETTDGISITEKILPLKSVGCYSPGGRAPYPSTVLMTVLPAKAAGVERVVLVSPPPISDEVLVAADICKVDEIYRLGGAQAVAALAYGTSSVKGVDKIVGPGNKYVMAAKMRVYGQVDIDMPAGPSEVLIIADENTNPSFVAADVLAQAEHDPNAQSVVVTDSTEKAQEVNDEIQKQARDLQKKHELQDSLKNSAIILTEDMDDTIEFTNMYAPEHLEILTSGLEPEEIAERIVNAGTIFLGEFSPVASGDYASGGNHVLPTGGSARFASELSVRDFLRNMSLQNLTKEGLRDIRYTVEWIAEAEGFIAHKRSVQKRFGE